MTHQSSIERPMGAIQTYREIENLVGRAKNGEHICLFKIKTNPLKRLGPRMQRVLLTSDAELYPKEIRCAGYTMLALYNLEGLK